MKELKSKKLLAAFLAMVMAIGMAACGSVTADDDESVNADTAKETAVTTAVDTDSSADESAAESEADESETESNTESVTDSVTDDSASDDEAEYTYTDGTYSNDVYTITVDESKWRFSPLGGKSAGFAYNGDCTAVITIVCEEWDGYKYSDLSEALENIMKEKHEEGYAVSGSYPFDLGYKSAYRYTQSGLGIEAVNIYASTDDEFISVSYSVQSSETTIDEMQSEFDEVIDTFTFAAENDSFITANGEYNFVEEEYYSDGKFSCEACSLTVDESKWECTVANYFMSCYGYISDPGITLGVFSTDYDSYAYDDFDSAIEAARENTASDGKTLSDIEETTFCGRTAYMYTATQNTDDISYESVIFDIPTENGFISVSYDAENAEATLADMQPEIDEVLNTFTFN